MAKAKWERFNISRKEKNEILLEAPLAKYCAVHFVLLIYRGIGKKKSLDILFAAKIDTIFESQGFRHT